MPLRSMSFNSLVSGTVTFCHSRSLTLPFVTTISNMFFATKIPNWHEETRDFSGYKFTIFLKLTLVELGILSYNEGLGLPLCCINTSFATKFK